MHANTSCPPLPLRSRLRPNPVPATDARAGEPVRLGQVPPQASWRVPRTAVPGGAQATHSALALPGAGHGAGSAEPTPMPPPPQRQPPVRPCSPREELTSPPRTPMPSVEQPDDSLWASPPDTARSLIYATRRTWPVSPGPAARFLSAWTYATSVEDGSGPGAGTPRRLGPLRSPGMPDAHGAFGTAPQNSPVPGAEPPLDSLAWEPGKSSPLSGSLADAGGQQAAASSAYHTPQGEGHEMDEDGEARSAEPSPGSSSGSSFGCSTAKQLERARR